jgi:hypothetical protein
MICRYVVQLNCSRYQLLHVQQLPCNTAWKVLLSYCGALVYTRHEELRSELHLLDACGLRAGSFFHKPRRLVGHARFQIFSPAPLSPTPRKPRRLRSDFRSLDNSARNDPLVRLILIRDDSLCFSLAQWLWAWRRQRRRHLLAAL